MDFWSIWYVTLWVFSMGALYTLILTVSGSVIGTALGLAGAFAKMSSRRLVRGVGSLYAWLFRGTPLLLQIWLIYFGLPQFHIVLPKLPSGIAALALNTGAYLTDILRAAVESIPSSQMEAARALGMTHNQAMRRVILPQAFRRMIPPTFNQFISLLKDSSLVATIGVTELLFAAKLTTASSFRPFDLYGIAAIDYLILTTLFTSAANWIEKKVIYE